MNDPRTTYDRACDASSSRRDADLAELRALRDAAMPTRKVFDDYDKACVAAEQRHTLRKDVARRNYLAARVAPKGDRS